MDRYPPIPGTTLFDGRQARKGYALNRMCFSFNEAAAPVTRSEALVPSGPSDLT